MSLVVRAQETVTLYGYVTEEASGEAIGHAQIFVRGTYHGTTTNANGFFSLKFRTDEDFELQVQHLGFEAASVSIRREQWPQVLLDVRLTRKVITLKEFVFEQPADRSRVLSTELGVLRFRADDVRRVPIVGGETDLLKVAQTSAGVMSGQELSNGLYVRGGSFDQNHFLLDGVTVYNPNHLFGFFSVFNTDALKEVELMKGGIPAEYGGRLSSVMNLTMKEGSREKFGARGGISLLTSRLTVEGPLGSAKRGSYLVSGRRTYLDPFTRLGSQQGSAGEKTLFYFYDLNLKINYDLGSNDRLFVSGYFGRDDMDFSQDDGDSKDRFRLRWGNSAYHVRYRRAWSPTFFTNSSVIYSDYRSTFLQSEDVLKKPSIADAQIKSDAEWHPSARHTLRLGAFFVKHWFKATSGLAETEDAATVALESYESRVYASHDWFITDRIRANAGLHGAYFHMGNYREWDPRVALRYQVNENFAIKAAYARMHQFIHVLSSLNLNNAGDIYYPSTEYLKPQTSRQWTIGMTKLFTHHWEWDLEIYHKEMRHQPLFRQDFSSAEPSRLREDVVLGKGWAYGVETGLQKVVGRITGWANYTFSKSYRKYTDKNGGRAFPPRFDRTHQLKVVMDYHWRERWKWGATFVLASGQPVTLPKQRFSLNNQDGRNENFDGVIDYGRLNDTRLPWYNRLDVSVTYSFTGWRLKWEIFCIVYNVYNYANPLWTEFDTDAGKFTQTTLGMLPTMGLSFTF